MSAPGWGKEWQLFEAFLCQPLGSLHSSWLELQKPKTMMSITVDTMFQTLMGAKNSEEELAESSTSVCLMTLKWCGFLLSFFECSGRSPSPLQHGALAPVGGLAGVFGHWQGREVAGPLCCPGFAGCVENSSH